MEKGFIKWLLIWIGTTTLIVTINVKAIMNQNWWIGIGFIPVSLLLLSMPIAGQKIGELATEATIHYQTNGVWRKKRR